MNHQCYEEGMAALLASHDVEVFTPFELAAVGQRHSTGVVLQPPPARLWPNIIRTALIAQEARRHFGRPMTVNTRAGGGLFGRGYRDPAYNGAVGGGTQSEHLRFRAMDVHITGIPVRDLHSWFLAHPNAGRMGIGRYNTFVHIDTRGTPARW
jgi:hypothetical protein